MRDIVFINKITLLVVTLFPCFVFAKFQPIFLYSMIFGLLLASLFLICLNFNNYVYRVVYIRVFVIFSLLFLWIGFFELFNSNSKFNSLIKDSDIKHIQGVLISDPILTEKSGALYSLNVKQTSNKDKTIICSSSGCIKIYSKTYSDKYTQGQRVSFKITGEKEELFFGTPEYSSQTTLLQQTRAKIKSWISQRLMAHSINIKPFISTEARILSRMLLLGFNDDLKLSLKDNSREVGLSHIFALSGLHLNIITSIISVLLFNLNNRFKEIITVFILIFYMFIIGYSPSLYRAVITYVCTTLFFKHNKDFAFIFSLFVQTILFPFTVISLSFQFSYVCTVCIVKFYPFIMFCLKKILPPILNRMISSGISAILISSLISIKEFGFWSFYGIVFSYPLCFFVCLSMVGGLLNILYQGNLLSNFIMETSYSFLKLIIDNLLKIKLSLEYKSYYIFIILLFVLFVLKIIFLNKKSLTNFRQGFK